MLQLQQITQFADTCCNTYFEFWNLNSSSGCSMPSWYRALMALAHGRYPPRSGHDANPIPNA